MSLLSSTTSESNITWATQNWTATLLFTDTQSVKSGKVLLASFDRLVLALLQWWASKLTEALIQATGQHIVYCASKCMTGWLCLCLLIDCTRTLCTRKANGWSEVWWMKVKKKEKAKIGPLNWSIERTSFSFEKSHQPMDMLIIVTVRGNVSLHS